MGAAGAGRLATRFLGFPPAFLEGLLGLDGCEGFADDFGPPVGGVGGGLNGPGVDGPPGGISGPLRDRGPLPALLTFIFVPLHARFSLRFSAAVRPALSGFLINRPTSLAASRSGSITELLEPPLVVTFIRTRPSGRKSKSTSRHCFGPAPICDNAAAVSRPIVASDWGIHAGAFERLHRCKAA